MSEIFLVIKVMLATLALIFVSQINLGGVTIENRVDAMITRSSLAGGLDKVAHGAVSAGESGFVRLKNWFNEKVLNQPKSGDEVTQSNSQRPGERKFFPELKRSEASIADKKPADQSFVE
jgi:hypothetical protein